jgi:hypothetical protein
MGHTNIRTTKICAYPDPEKFHGIFAVPELGDKKSQNKEKVVGTVKTNVRMRSTDRESVDSWISL